MQTTIVRKALAAVVVLAIAFVGACADDDDGTSPEGPFTLTFAGDASFQGAHGGQAIEVAVVRTSDGQVAASDGGTVSASSDPAFSFTFSNVLEAGESYEVHYWIDSNFGGTAGVCDPPENDHQWRVDVGAADDDVTITEVHEPGGTEPVCGTFAANLTFAGDASFQGAHGDQDVYVAVMRAQDDPTVIVREAGTVSSSADPAFSFSFPNLLAKGTQYQVRYWIDSNFGDGTRGVCDAPEVDHQWRVDIDEVEDDVSLTEPHEPGETAGVCETFSADLTFAGDASFQGAHGGQTVSLALVRTSDSAVILRETDTVSAADDPAFEFSLDGVLVPGLAYEAHYWIDSNFGGGTEGVCDPPETDHQWAVELGVVDGDVEQTEPHEPGETQDVCGSFDA